MSICSQLTKNYKVYILGSFIHPLRDNSELDMYDQF